MRIQHNIMAMNSYRNLAGNNSALSKNLEKLSSGYRINRAGDDAAGLAISEKMRAQISGLDQAQKNAQSGINLVKTAEGALTEVHDMLNRMVTLATQSANGTYGASDRQKLQAEINALTSEIDRIAENSNFNGTKLLDGTIGTTEAATTEATVGKVTLSADAPATVEVDMAYDTNADEITVTIGDTTFKGTTADATAAEGVEKTFTYTKGASAEDINKAIVEALGEEGTVKIDGTDYKLSANGSKLVLTGAVDGIPKVGGDGDEHTIETLTAKMKESISASSKTNAAEPDTKPEDELDGDAVTFSFGEYVAGVEDTSGASLTATLTGLSGIAEGDLLTIGDTTYAITLDGASTEAGGNTLLDLSDVAEDGVTAAELADKLNEQSPAADGFDVTVEAKGDDLTVTFEGTAYNAAHTEESMKSLALYAPAAEASSVSLAAAAPAVTAEEPAAEEPEAPAADEKGLTLQIGADSGETIKVKIGSMKADALGIKDLDIGDVTKANAAIDTIKAAIETVSVQRGELGAIQNRLEHTINNLGVMEENIQDAEANIRDTDIADEMMAYTKNNILIQSAQAMLAQANQVPQGVLQLMG